MNKEKTTGNKGITLIALIITIIVMLILVTVSITMAVKGGLFKYASDAGKGTKEKMAVEQEWANGDIIEYYLSKKDSVEKLPEYGKASKVGGILTQNAKYESGYMSAVIPKGFKVSDVAEEQTITGGLVIKDEDGNEFVWVPVEITKTDTKTSIAAMERTNWGNNNPITGLSMNYYTEPYASGYTNEEKEYYDMLESVYTYGGFYIGRYEAGSEKPRYDTENKTTEMSVKRGKYPYNYVGWGPKMNNYEGTVTWDSKDQGYGAG